MTQTLCFAYCFSGVRKRRRGGGSKIQNNARQNKYITDSTRREGSGENLGEVVQARYVQPKFSTAREFSEAGAQQRKLFAADGARALQHVLADVIPVHRENNEETGDKVQSAEWTLTLDLCGGETRGVRLHGRACL